MDSLLSRITIDPEVCRIALDESRAVITKDTDFYYSRLLYGRPDRLVLVRTGNIGVRQLIDLFRRQLLAIVAALESHSLIDLTQSTVQPSQPLS